MPKILLVLNDGATYGELSGCHIVAVDEEQIDQSSYDMDTIVETICRAYNEGIAEDSYLGRNPDIVYAFQVAEVIGSFE